MALYRKNCEESGKKYYTETKEKMQQLVVLINEIHRLSSLEDSCCIPGDRTVIFGKFDDETNAIRNIARRYDIKI